MIDLKVEAAIIKSVAEEVFTHNRDFLTMFAFFQNHQRVGALTLRHTEDSEDRYIALTEACTLMPFFHVDEVVYAFDSYFSVNPTPGTKLSENDSSEAIMVLRFTEKGMDGVIMPYERPDEHHVLWQEQVTDFDMSMIDTRTLSIFRHFIQYHAHLNGLEEMMETLSKRGHEITFIPKEHRVEVKRYEKIIVEESA